MVYKSPCHHAYDSHQLQCQWSSPHLSEVSGSWAKCSYITDPVLRLRMPSHNSKPFLKGLKAARGQSLKGRGRHEPMKQGVAFLLYTCILQGIYATEGSCPIPKPPLSVKGVAHVYGSMGTPADLHSCCTKLAKPPLTGPLSWLVSGGARQKAASSGMATRHCMMELAKQVLPRFVKPTKPCAFSLFAAAHRGC